MDFSSPVDYRGFLQGPVGSMEGSMYFNKADFQKLSEKDQESFVIKNFVTVLYRKLFKSMRSTIGKDGLFKSSFVSDLYTDMFDNSVSLAAAQGKDVSRLVDAIRKQLQKKAGYRSNEAAGAQNLLNIKV